MYNIAYIADSRYVIPTKASINSIVKNITSAQVAVHVLAIGLSDEDKASICNMESKNVAIRILDFENNLAEVGLDHLYVSKAALFKFKLPLIFKDLDRILYLDGDIILSKDFLSIFDFDISDRYAAVVGDMIADRLCLWGSKINHDKYFNSGMMFINLRKWREDGICEKLIEYKKNDRENHFMDQNALNATIGNNVLWIGPKYNLLACCTESLVDSFFKDGKSLQHMAEYHGISCEEMANAIKNPEILHMAGQKKAWKTISADRADEWLDYLPPEDQFEIIKRYCHGLHDSLGSDQKRIDSLSQLVSKQGILIERQGILIEEQGKRIGELAKENRELKGIVNEIRGISFIGIYIEIRKRIQRLLGRKQ